MNERIPWTLILTLLAMTIPLFATRYYTDLATYIAIFALFATSLNILIGSTGLVSFGHAAYFGIGAYICGIFMGEYGVPFLLAWLLAGVGGGIFAAIFGYFCMRLTSIYFSMLTLAFAQIVWGICFKWNDVTGGEQGYPRVPMVDMSWMSSLPVVGTMRPIEKFFFIALILSAVCIAIIRRITRSPFGRILNTIRDNPERTQFIGIDVRRYRLYAFILAGVFAGLAGGLFGIYKRGVYPDYAYWAKSAEVLIMTLLGGIHSFWGPTVGAATLILLNGVVVSYTEYWPFVLGLILLVLLFALPGGIVGGLTDLYRRIRSRSDA